MPRAGSGGPAVPATSFGATPPRLPQGLMSFALHPAYVRTPMDVSRMMGLRAPSPLGRDDPSAVNLHGDALSQQLDGDHEQSPIGVLPHQNALHIRERPTDNADALSLMQVGVRQHREIGSHHGLDRLDFGVRYHGQSIPALPQN